MLEQLSTILTQFAGGASPEDNVFPLMLAAFFWLTLIWLARHQRQYEANIKRMLIIGFTLGFLREALMIAVFFIDYTGILADVKMHPYYPYLEHLLSSVGVVWIMAAFMSYLLNSRFGRRFLAFGLMTTGVVFIITIPGWASLNNAIPALIFSQNWYGFAWHVNGVLLTGSAMLMMSRIPGWPRLPLFAALSCFFLDNTLMLINLASGQAYAAIYNPIQYALRVAAIPLLGYIFMREQWERQELHEAELLQNKRALHSLAETLEDQVLERTAELEVTAMRLQQAEKLAHLGSWSYVKEDDRFFCSEEMFNIFELPYNESGISFKQLKSYINADDLDVMEHRFALLLKKGGGFDQTYSIHLPDGRIKYLHAMGISGITQDEDVTGTIQDVTLHVMQEIAMQERELELIASRQVAEQANRAKSAFLATMSHEIRTPMNAMMGNLTLLSTTFLTELQQQSLRNCTSASQILLRVINDILDFSKIEAGKIELVQESYSPRRMIDNLVGIFAGRAEDKQLRLNLEVTGQLPAGILGDRLRLSQIISNLLSNAIKFTQQGKVTLSVSIKTSDQGGVQLVVSVGDSGIGIPLEQQSVIFDSFTQLDNFSTRRHSGTGLGLAISRQLVELMGGGIVLSSAPDEGAIFTVTIPVTLCEAPATTKSKKALKGTARKILLADDEPLGRNVITALLERSGHTVKAVEDGKTILDTLQRERFDILLSDISMPDMDGTQVARIIRSGEREGVNPLIPIIAMTAHTFPQDRERFLDCGINDYIAKPINFDELLELIEETCGNSTIVPPLVNSDCILTAKADVRIPLFSEA
jgi:signal transduction histidine kinase/CheY-like chemotaxis protein